MVEVKFGDWLDKSFTLYKDNFGLLLVVNLLAALLGSITLGILIGPMTVGVILVTLALIDKRVPKPEIGEVFKGFDYFLNSFVFTLVWGLIALVVVFILAIIPCVNMIAVPLFAVVLGTFLMFGLFLIADRKQEFWPASQASFAKVKENFWPWCGYFLLASVIGSLGQILCGIGMIITLPMTYCMIAVAYREAFAPEQAAASMAPAPEQPPLSPPAPPSAG